MQFVYECLRVKLLSILITITHAIAYTNAISKVQLGPTTILKYSLGLDVGYTEPVFSFMCMLLFDLCSQANKRNNYKNNDL